MKTTIQNNFYRYFPLVILVTACQTVPTDSTHQTWQELSKIHQNNINIAYDPHSIKVQGDTVSISDRKIVVDTKKENYLNTPPFKTAIGEWEFHCRNRTYRLTQIAFWDTKGQSQGKYTFTPSQTQPTHIIPNSPSEQLFNLACPNH